GPVGGACHVANRGLHGSHGACESQLSANTGPMCRALLLRCGRNPKGSLVAATATTAAVATAASAATAATAAVAATTTATGARALFARLGLVHRQRPAAQL